MNSKIENKNLKKDKKHLVESLSSHLFWDLNKSTLSGNDSDIILIQRVIEYGIMTDWTLIQDYYGLDYIKKIALQLKNLDDVSLAFLCTIFHIEKTDFRCYKHKLSSPHFWNY